MSQCGLLKEVREEATDAVMYSVAQVLQGVINALEHEKTRLGYPGTVPIVEEHEASAATLVGSLLECLAEDIDKDCCLAVGSADRDDLLSDCESDYLVAAVTKECKQQLKQI